MRKKTYIAAFVVGAVTLSYLVSVVFLPQSSTPSAVVGNLVLAAATLMTAALAVGTAYRSVSRATVPTSDDEAERQGLEDGDEMRGGDAPGVVNVPDSVDNGGDSSLESLSTASEGSEAFEVVGTEFDSLVKVSVDYDTDEDRRAEARRKVVEELRDTAALVQSNTTELSVEDARETVLDGSWTRDRRAAAFLSEEGEAETPLSLRLYDLLVGRDPFLSSVEHALDALEEMEVDG